MPRLGAIWQVRAGMIPGEEDPKLSKDFVLVDGARSDFDKFVAAGAAAHAYCGELEGLCASGRTCNWVRVEFVWM